MTMLEKISMASFKTSLTLFDYSTTSLLHIKTQWNFQKKKKKYQRAHKLILEKIIKENNFHARFE